MQRVKTMSPSQQQKPAADSSLKFDAIKNCAVNMFRQKTKDLTQLHALTTTGNELNQTHKHLKVGAVQLQKFRALREAQVEGLKNKVAMREVALKELEELSAEAAAEHQVQAQAVALTEVCNKLLDETVEKYIINRHFTDLLLKVTKETQRRSANDWASMEADLRSRSGKVRGWLQQIRTGDVSSVHSLIGELTQWSTTRGLDPDHNEKISKIVASLTVSLTPPDHPPFPPDDCTAFLEQLTSTVTHLAAESKNAAGLAVHEDDVQQLMTAVSNLRIGNATWNSTRSQLSQLHYLMDALKIDQDNAATTLSQTQARLDLLRSAKHSHLQALQQQTSIRDDLQLQQDMWEMRASETQHSCLAVELEATSASATTHAVSEEMDSLRSDTTLASLTLELQGSLEDDSRLSMALNELTLQDADELEKLTTTRGSESALQAKQQQLRGAITALESTLTTCNQLPITALTKSFITFSLDDIAVEDDNAVEDVDDEDLCKAVQLHLTVYRNVTEEKVHQLQSLLEGSITRCEAHLSQD